VLGIALTDRFRELERLGSDRKKDVVLMATVTSFECLPRPSKSELRQFAELFMPLFMASSEEARREAIAALAQNPNVPQPVAFFIASQPIALSAPFLIGSKCLSDETLITIARTQGAAHARAIVRRNDLSPTVIDALVGLRYVQPQRTQALEAEGERIEVNPAPSITPADDLEERASDMIEREEALRAQLKEMALQHRRSGHDRLGMLSLTPMQDALMVRTAREKDASQFATTLCDALSSSRWLAERILLDISGHQLSTTLIGFGMGADEVVSILESFYPHLKRPNGNVSRARFMVDLLDPIEAEQRLDSWRKADQTVRRAQNGDEDQVQAFAEAPRKWVVRR
jgi:uncharacterized protein (DUF2336 family)